MKIATTTSMGSGERQVPLGVAIPAGERQIGVMVDYVVIIVLCGNYVRVKLPEIV
jgi:hypothetical protein